MTTTFGTAIKASITTRSIVTFAAADCAPNIIEDLMCEAAEDDGDSVLANDVWDFWGTTDSGDEWRVRIKLATQSEE